MALGLLKSILDTNRREIRRLEKRAAIINDLEPGIQALGDDDLRAKTQEFRRRLSGGESLDQLLPEAFAVVREASRRALGMRHFDVQLIGGMVLHDGKIAEMKTGEGKTLVATLPAYLNALAGDGVHIVTVNDYLARRDAEWMGQIHQFLGLETGVIVHGLDNSARRRSYGADITYGTNNEFGFDYLRDNMVFRPEQMAQRPLSYAIVDEVDSILIDEARTPLIISGQGDAPKPMYRQMADLIRRLKEEQDFTVDEKAKRSVLTEDGVAKMERLLNLTNLYDPENAEAAHHVNQALHARALMKRDVDYVVKDGQIIIVDEFTGRLMFGRRYNEGLHQAIEAKENVQVEKESQTLASITFQNYFRMYGKLAGMTGTAMTEEEEFRKIYKLDVVTVPTNMPMVRRDMPDIIYRSEAGKFHSVVEDIARRHDTGQPVLVGTISIERSELLSDLLRQKGITHNVLNAKFHEQEAVIVAQAGRLGAVTVSTNMAGRGTDIILGGNPEFIVRQNMLVAGLPPEVVEIAASHSVIEAAATEHQEARRHYQEQLATVKRETDAEHERVVAAGGLHIIGTERHESRRIDNQLRGRSGRQGDMGSSQFYISMEDDLMRLFGGDNLIGIMDKLGMDDDMPLENNMITKALEGAQRRVEARNFELRKNVLEYDDVMNEQRRVIYDQRRRVLENEDLRATVVDMIEKVTERTVDRFAGGQKYVEEWDLSGMLDYAYNHFLPSRSVRAEDLSAGQLTPEEVRELILTAALADYEARENSLGPEMMRDLERMITLRTVDQKWMDHLDAMDQMRQGIGLRAIGQRDPLVEYRHEAYAMFSGMIADIQEEITRFVYFVNVVERPQERRNLVASHNDSAGGAFGASGGTAGSAGSGAAIRQAARNRGAAAGGRALGQPPAAKKQPAVSSKVRRNELCPCGSGKKYKKCCGKTSAED
ncbi:MAG: preprotein translocase subunit SecA [Peptococcaceae bacterium]|jgi:preprotein translocase subunit SecA|nr:preprotein translocase subunit SecA [Peptococcaceae bacterium]